MRHSVSAKWKSLHNCQGRFGNRYSPSTARYRTCSLKWCAIHCTHNGKAVSALLLRSYSTDFNQIWYSGQDTLCFSEATRLISTKSDIRGKIRFASQKLLDWFQPHLIFGARYALLLRSYSTDFNQIWYSGQDTLCFSEATRLISTTSDIRGKICPHHCVDLILGYNQRIKIPVSHETQIENYHIPYKWFIYKN